ncbi:MAG: flavodoxin family protein [Asgard group archaeon]
MKCVIVYDTKFGNNKQLCEAVGKDLERDMEVKCFFVDEATVDDVKAADLVIIGGPTHVLRASRKMRKFLKELSKSKEEFSGKKAIAYGTKAGMGSAAKSIEKRLRKMGFDVIADPVDFYVIGRKGPFKEGEIERMIAHVRKAIG